MSAGLHLAGIVALALDLSWRHKIDDQVESVPVEMVTTSDFNQIMNGEKTAKQMPTPQRRVDQVAEFEDKKSAPPIPESKKDTPPPPSPEKANADPGQDEKPAEEANAPPPPPAPPVRPQPVVPPPPVPTPPERPVEKSEAQPKADPVKPPPEDAEAIEQKPQPQPRPKVEAKKPPKKIAKQPPKKAPVPPERPVEEAKEVPDPPRKPAPEEPSLKQRTLDQVAKLLDSMKPPKPVVKQRSGNEVKEAKHSDFSLDRISALLDHEAPQRTASRGQKLTQLASLGSPTAHADKMSPSLMAQIDGWFIDRYRGCWSYFGLGAATGYVPKVHVLLARDGTLLARPVLLNPTNDPNLRSLADSAIRAVNKCNPLPIPDWVKAHYDAWRDRPVNFDPKEMS